jgi:hypothetical protein
MKRLALVSIAGVLSLMAFSPIVASAQAQDPLVGAWNIKGGSGPSAFIAVMTFNAGGTTVEYDTQGTNSSASPGESISLGKWTNVSGPNYTFKEENYIYDSSGNLSLLNVTSCTLKLASNQNSFSDNCTDNFYECSVESCPGTLVATGSGTATGNRF